MFRFFQTILNFTLDAVTPKVIKVGDRLPNGTWDGIIGQLQRGQLDFGKSKLKIKAIIIKKHNTAPCDLVMTHERSDGLDFMLPYNTGFDSFYIKNPIDSYNFTAYLEPLHLYTWIVVAIWCMVMPLIFYLLYK